MAFIVHYLFLDIAFCELSQTLQLLSQLNLREMEVESFQLKQEVEKCGTFQNTRLNSQSSIQRKQWQENSQESKLHWRTQVAVNGLCSCHHSKKRILTTIIQP